MSVVVAEDRRAWGSLPGEVHRIFIEEYERTGASPPTNVLAQLLDADPTLIGRALKGLCADGVLAQPYGPRSGYIPLYRPDGTRVKPKLVVVGGEGEKEAPRIASVDLEQINTEELLAEVLRRTQRSEDK